MADDTRPLIKYLVLLPDEGDPNALEGQAMPLETYSPELARQEAAAYMECDPKQLHVIDVSNDPEMLAVVTAMLASLKKSQVH